MIDETDEMEKDPYGRIIIERWPYLPLVIKIEIFLTVFYYAWQRNLAEWWLKVCSINAKG